MNTEKWVQEQLDHLVAASKDYRQKALFQETKKLFREQYERMEQMEGELDGRAEEVTACLRTLVGLRLAVAHPGYDQPDSELD